MDAMDEALQLAQLFPEFQQRGDGYYVSCPAHDDESPSLCISNGDKGRVWFCHAGCAQATVTKALQPYLARLEPGDNGTKPTTAPPPPPKQIVAEYNYLDEKSKLLYQVVRFEPKDFRQRKSDATAKGGWLWKVGNVRKVLYRLPEILDKPSVVIVEGEKDALALAELGIPATCNVGGAGKWKRTYSESLRDKKIAIIADRDGPGRRHAEDVASQLYGIASSVRVLEPTFPHKDSSEWITKGKAGHSDIVSAIKATPEWTPTASLVHAVITEDEAPDLAHITGWPHGLLMGDKGPRALGFNAAYALEAYPPLKEMVALDTFTGRIVFLRDAPWGTPAQAMWSDEDDTGLSNYLQAIDIRIGSDVADRAVRYYARDKQFDSLQDYLSTLKWDGIPRLGYVSNLLGAPSDLSSVLISKWVISAVARAMRPGCQVDHVLVLEGTQGIRKSTALRTLFDPIDKGWFRDDLPPLNSKDAQQFLQGTWCIEIAELDAVNSRRAELEHVKAFLSRRIDSYRPPYGRKVQDFPRRVVFAGSTNDAHYLKDTTGNRRWWPIACESAIQVDKLAKDAPQIWAEAVQRFNAGEQWWLDSTLPANADLAREQEARRTIDPWEAEISTYILHRNHCTMDDLLAHLKVSIDKRSQVDSNRAQRILSLYGWTRKQFNDRGTRWWCYVADPSLTWGMVRGDTSGEAN